MSKTPFRRDAAQCLEKLWDENEELITVLYSGMLNLDPSDKKFREWVGVLGSGMSPTAVATAFYRSREYQAKEEIKSAWHSPFFIAGSPRSGTSAVVDVLWHIGYQGFGEGHFLTLLHYIDAIVDQHYVWFPGTDPGVMLGNIDKGNLKRRFFEMFQILVNDLNRKSGGSTKQGIRR